MLRREDIFKYIKETYDVSPDYPWKSFPDFAALRHKNNRKWFGLIMSITGDKLGLENPDEIDVINLKVPKEFVGALRKEDNIFQAYHMDKNNWVSVVLDFTENIGEIDNVIEDSFNLTK